MGAQALGIVRSVLRHLRPVHTGRESTLFMESEPAGRGDRFEGGRRSRAGDRVLRSPQWKVCRRRGNGP